MDRIQEARRLLAELEAVIERAPLTSPLSRARERATFARLIADANRAIARVNAEAPTARQHRRPLDQAAEAERLERGFGRVEQGRFLPRASPVLV